MKIENKEIPVVVQAHNKPKFLDRCLNSLKPQIDNREIYLFIDGPSSQEDQILIQQSIQLARKKISSIQIHTSQQYLGEPLSTKRCRDFIFEKSDKAIFISENIAANSYYLNQTEYLYDLVSQKTDKCGSVSCYFGSKFPPEYQVLFKNKVVTDTNCEAYLMTRDCYDAIYDDLEDFYKMTQGLYLSDVAKRIVRKEWGLGNSFNGTIQEATVASMYRNGYFKLSTVSNHCSDSQNPIISKINEQVEEFDLEDHLISTALEELKEKFEADIDYRQFEIKYF